MERSSPEFLRKRFNMFNHVLGETLENQLQRFVTLVTDMRSANIQLPRIATNNKLINSLPQAWDMNVAVFKKTTDLSTLSLAELIAIIKSFPQSQKPSATVTVTSGVSSPTGLSEEQTGLCSDSCIKKVDLYRMHNSRLVTDVEKKKMEILQLKKNEQKLKEKLEASNKDFKKLQNDFSVKCCHILDYKKEIAELKAKLETSNLDITKLTNKFENADFNFKKFDGSSAVVESMIEKQLKWKEKKGEGLGYNEVPPPYNDNYTSLPLSQAEIEREKTLKYGKPEIEEKIIPGFVKPAQSVEKVNDTNVSPSCTDEVIIEDWVDDEDELSVLTDQKNFTIAAFSVLCDLPIDKTVTEESAKPVDVKQSCVNECNANIHSFADDCEPVHNKQKEQTRANRRPGIGHPDLQSKQKMKNQKKSPQQKAPANDKYKHPNSSSFARNVQQKQAQKGPVRPSGPARANPADQNAFYLKRQTCFNCGIAGHIARNCKHRPYAPYYMQNQRVIPKNHNHYKPMKVSSPKAMKNVNPKVKPSDGDWKAAKNKRKAVQERNRVSKTNKLETAKVAQPKATNTFVKPKQNWKPKSKAATSPIFETKGDMCLMEVSYFDASGKPRTTMAWVPLSC